MKPIDLKDLVKEIDQFVQERDWSQFHSIKNLSMALSVEASELLEIFQWMTEEKSNQAAQDENLRERIQDEVADIFIYLLRIINHTGIDLEKAVKLKMEKNAAKYPVEKAKGNSRKYDEL